MDLVGLKCKKSFFVIIYIMELDFVGKRVGFEENEGGRREVLEMKTKENHLPLNLISKRWATPNSY